MIYSEVSAKTCENLNETIENFTKKIVNEIENKKTKSELITNSSQTTILNQEKIYSYSNCSC